MDAPALRSDGWRMIRQRLKPLLLVTLGGMAIGISGDYFLSPAPFIVSDVLSALLLSPFVVTLGGSHVSIQGFETLFLIGGLLFWPVYFGLAVFWLRGGRLPFLLLILPWTAQGFFEVSLRLWVMSGV